MVRAEFQASVGDIICKAVLHGSYETTRKIPPPTSQMPLGSFERRILDGFCSKRLTSLMIIKRAIMLVQCFPASRACSSTLYLYGAGNGLSAVGGRAQRPRLLRGGGWDSNTGLLTPNHSHGDALRERGNA